IDSADAGEHVLDKALMPRNVYEPNPQRRCQLQVGESEVDCDTAAFLFFEPVSVDTGESFDEGRLAMINVAGRADDDVLNPGVYIVTSSPRRRRDAEFLGYRSRFEAFGTFILVRAQRGQREHARRTKGYANATHDDESDHKASYLCPLSARTAGKASSPEP